VTFAALNLPGFATRTICECIERAWNEARNAKRSRARFFEHIRTLTASLVPPDWYTLVTPPESRKESHLELLQKERFLLRLAHFALWSVRAATF